MWWFSIAMVIFYSYVGLPEGVYIYIYVCVCLFFPVIDTQQETLGCSIGVGILWWFWGPMVLVWKWGLNSNGFSPLKQMNWGPTPFPTNSGWWFGTFYIFPYIGKNHPNWLIFFRGVETTNQNSFRICRCWSQMDMPEATLDSVAQTVRFIDEIPQHIVHAKASSL